MPTPALMQIPKSSSAEEFESICTDVLSDSYGTRFSIYGRKGQKQNGIDIFTQNKDSCIVAQCKNYYLENSSERLVRQIKNDIVATKETDFNIIRFIAMTSMNRDNKVQNDILKINSDFFIELWFWEEIQTSVCSNTQLLKKYYPHFFESQEISIDLLNDVIFNLNVLKNIACKFNNEYKEYRVGCDPNIDMQGYNQCVSIFNAILNLRDFRDTWYLQLCKSNGNIDGNIEKILKSTPDFYDANRDWTGSNMIYTLSNYIEYFCSNENAKKFIKNCDDLIEQLKKI